MCTVYDICTKCGKPCSLILSDTAKEVLGVRKEEPIEKAYPEAYRLARRFHELYEENAPLFGYETRPETKKFDPDSPNGRLMAYVCKTLLDEFQP